MKRTVKHRIGEVLIAITGTVYLIAMLGIIFGVLTT